MNLSLISYSLILALCQIKLNLNKYLLTLRSIAIKHSDLSQSIHLFKTISTYIFFSMYVFTCESDCQFLSLPIHLTKSFYVYLYLSLPICSSVNLNLNLSCLFLSSCHISFIQFKSMYFCSYLSIWICSYLGLFLKTQLLT